jgi:predicted secreted protein
MSDVFSNVSQVAKRPSVYQSESIQQKPSTEERDGLTRLNQILGSDQPLRDNVPRGF